MINLNSFLQFFKVLSLTMVIIFKYCEINYPMYILIYILNEVFYSLNEAYQILFTVIHSSWVNYKIKLEQAYWTQKVNDHYKWSKECVTGWVCECLINWIFTITHILIKFDKPYEHNLEVDFEMSNPLATNKVVCI